MLMELNRDMDEKFYRLEQSELARKNTFSNITHDLRAPVAVIRGAVERLSNDNIGKEERKGLLRIIDSRTMVLEQLVNDMYLSMLVNQPEFSLNLSCLEIAPLLEEYFISMKGAGRLDNRNSHLIIPGGFSSRAMIDSKYFLRVLDNLFSNAIRHTKPGEIIEMGCRDIGNQIEIYVQDSGTGIPTDDIPYIFDRTYSGERARTPGKAGSGLGLSIAKSIMEKHNGSINFHSVYGNGATFIVTLAAV